MKRERVKIVDHVSAIAAIKWLGEKDMSRVSLPVEETVEEINHERHEKRSRI